METSDLNTNRTSPGEASPAFPTTLWTAILASQRSPSSSSLAARDRLCRAYWYPVYAFMRRNGQPSADAQDLTQELLAQIMTPETLGRLQPANGRFRTYLLSAAKHLILRRRNEANALKRGGGAPMVSINEQDAEGRYLHEPLDHRTPEDLLNQTWAQNVLTEALMRLGTTYEQAGKRELFASLRVFLEEARSNDSYADLAARHGLSLAAMKTEIFRLRRRYGETLLEVVGETVTTSSELDEEMSELFRALGRISNQ